MRNGRVTDINLLLYIGLIGYMIGPCLFLLSQTGIFGYMNTAWNVVYNATANSLNKTSLLMSVFCTPDFGFIHPKCYSFVKNISLQYYNTTL